MKRLLLLLSVLLLLLFFVQTKTQASSFNELPFKQKTDQWSVELSEAKNEKEFASPKKGEYKVYSVEIKNIGKKVATADVQLFRDDPSSITKYSLFSCPDEKCEKQSEDSRALAENLNDGSPLRFKHIMLADKASELEVEIIWSQKGQEGRNLKQTFKFTEDSLN
ncbi:hypothetical protein [Bacillus atrophaeus]|uniref:hypothetical protein n=1 Tax=Bacillus atrophaeus TaxID=1452 RepID=UPI002E22EAE4|nr:hypothetical protein [Bacillus atrophaeus]MED1029767.1 hypothetical protein [Bacillus atrophaeus]MED1117518.1 hypothetical protein [Bacillus atrophaeus]MED1131290.1 hypothetical protein [Bacillus atrophaeus]